MSLTDNENPFTNAHIVIIQTEPTDCDLEIVMEEFEEEVDEHTVQEDQSNQLISYKRKSIAESSEAVKKVKHQQVQEIDQEEDEKEEDVKDEETEEIHKFVTLELNCTQPDCKLTFKSLEMWKEHLKTSHGQIPYKHLQDNVRHNQLGQTEHPCTDCKVVHKSQHSLNQHWRMYHLPGKFQCSVCEFVAKLASEIGVHQRKHHVKKFQCTDEGCNRVFRSKQSLEQHKHAYDRPYKCVWANCEEDFKYHSQALAHVRLHHFNKGDTRDPQWYVRRL